MTRPVLLLLALGCLMVLATASRNTLLSTSKLSISSLMSSDCQPDEVHLALTSDPSAVRVTWTTASPGCEGAVRFSRQDQLLAAEQQPAGSGQMPWLSTEVQHAQYDEGMFCAAPACLKSFQLHQHSAVMAGLAHNTAYVYSLPGSTQRLGFTSPKARGSTQPFSFIAFGDMGAGTRKARKNPKALQTVNRVALEMGRGAPTDFILHVGDIAYADGKASAWTDFMQQVQPLSSKVPYMVAGGNHEGGQFGYERNARKCRQPATPPGVYRSEQRGVSGAAVDGADDGDDSRWDFGDDSGGECGAMIMARFPMPGSGGIGLDAAAAATTAGATATARRLHAAGSMRQPDAAAAQVNGTEQGPASSPPFWYSYAYASVHFIVISTEHSLARGSAQMSWLLHELEGIDRCVTPWVVLALHRPMYVVYPHKQNREVGDQLRDALEDLLLRYNVDLTIAGHVHSYYRTCTNVNHGRCLDALRASQPQDGKGLDEAAEAGITHFVVGSAGHELSAVDNDQPDWLGEALMDWGFVRFDVDGDVMRARFILSEDGSVGDEVTLRAAVAPGAAC